MSSSRPGTRLASAMTVSAAVLTLALTLLIVATVAAAVPGPDGPAAAPAVPADSDGGADGAGGAGGAGIAGGAAATPLALSCLGCHQPDLGPDEAAIDLARLDAGRLRAALLAYRDGQRVGTVMPRLARGLTAIEIEQLSRQLTRR